MISADEIERRKPVWIALSEFYLDTELDTKDFERISNTFRESGYTLNELKRINYDEVAPVVSPNLFSTAGVWSGFDEEWLQAEIVKKVKRANSKQIFNSIYRRYIDWTTNRYWKRIEKMINVANKSFNSPAEYSFRDSAGRTQYIKSVESPRWETLRRKRPLLIH